MQSKNSKCNCGSGKNYKNCCMGKRKNIILPDGLIWDENGKAVVDHVRVMQMAEKKVVDNGRITDYWDIDENGQCYEKGTLHTN